MERQAEWKKMMAGGVSHLSKVRSKVRQREQEEELDSLESARKVLSLISRFISVFHFQFVSIFIGYLIVQLMGPHFPEWVQSTAEGGELFGICFRFNVLAFRDLFSSVCLFCICLHSHHD
jgi:hypothetical protein